MASNVGNPVAMVSERNETSEIKQSMQRIEEMLFKLLAEKKSQEINRPFQEGRSAPPPSAPPPTPDPPDPMKARKISAPSPRLCAHRPQQIHQGGQIYPRNHVTRLSKMEIPKYDGTRMREWVALCEEFFYLNRTVPELMVREASLHFEGKALQWHHDYIRNRYGLYPLWPEYMIDMSARFGWDAGIVDCNGWVGSNTLSDETDWNVQRIGDLKDYGVVYTPRVTDDNQMVTKASAGRVTHQVLDEMSAQNKSNDIEVNAHLNEVLDPVFSQLNRDVKRAEMDELSSLDEFHSNTHQDSSKVVEISNQTDEIAQKQEVDEFKASNELNQGEEVPQTEVEEEPIAAAKESGLTAYQVFDETLELTGSETEISAAFPKKFVMPGNVVSQNGEQGTLSFDPGGSIAAHDDGYGTTGCVPEVFQGLSKINGPEGFMGNIQYFGVFSAMPMHFEAPTSSVDESRVQGSAMGYKTHQGEEPVLSLETSSLNQPPLGVVGSDLLMFLGADFAIHSVGMSLGTLPEFGSSLLVANTVELTSIEATKSPQLVSYPEIKYKEAWTLEGNSLYLIHVIRELQSIDILATDDVAHELQLSSKELSHKPALKALQIWGSWGCLRCTSKPIGSSFRFHYLTVFNTTTYAAADSENVIERVCTRVLGVNIARGCPVIDMLLVQCFCSTLLADSSMEFELERAMTYLANHIETERVATVGNNLLIFDPGSNLFMLTVAVHAIYLMTLRGTHHDFSIPLLVARIQGLISTEAKSSVHVWASSNDSSCAAIDPNVLLIYVSNGSESDVMKQLNWIGKLLTAGFE